jgi:hypothetical protein
VAPRTVIGVASEEHLDSFLELTATHYQGEPVNDPSFVRWRHLDGPSGPSATVELVDGDEVVGRMWINVMAWSVGGREVRAANPVDFLIREDHRRLPAFMGLFRSTMNESLQRAELVYHTSNPLTDDLYRKLMKLEPVTELDGALVPTRPFGAAQATGVFRSGPIGRAIDSGFAAVVRAVGLAARVTGVRLGSPPSPAEQDEVVRRFVGEEPVCNTRHAAHRAWRHRGAGVIRYDERWVFRRGRPIGYVVTSDRDIADVRGCFVIDAVLPGRPSPLIVAALWLQVAAAAARRGRHAVFFLHNRANPRLARLARLPMITVPRTRLPQRVPVFVRPARDADPGLLAGVDLSAGYFVLSDFDMF